MASPSSYQSLLQWRPRYWLPACVSRMGLDPTTLRSRLAMALGTLILLSWVIACWAFHDQMTAPGQEDKFWLCMRCVLAFSALTCIRRWWGEACRCPVRS